jgi:predicted branched-subunit amino acid permease
MSSLTTSQSAVFGIRCSSGYFVSTFLFGLMFGVAAAESGLTQWQGIVMSSVVFSASAQFSALELWSVPLPVGTIALSVFLVSTRNILLGMSMSHHFDGHSNIRKATWLFLLNDPGVVTALRLEPNVDRLGYITGYGVSLMASWLISTWIGVSASHYLGQFDFGSLRFAGPLILAIMMVLFTKGSNSSPIPWMVSAVVSLILFELNTPIYWFLPIAVTAGVIGAIVHKRIKNV